MNKYEKELDELQKEFEKEVDDFNNRIQRMQYDAQLNCDKYNTRVHGINSSRNNLILLLRKFYNLLSQHGDIGEKLTPFDFIYEDSQRIGHNGNYQVSFSNAEDETNSSSFGNLSVGLGIAAGMFVPIAIPTGFFVKYIFNRFKSKKELEQAYTKIEDERNKMLQKTEDARAAQSFFSTAANIAERYHEVIKIVELAVEESIIPELSGISAFLSADAIKEAILYDDDPDLSEQSKISDFQNTAFDNHYTFVRNSVDYYNTLCAFFTDNILTNIVDDNKITSHEKSTFFKQAKNIEHRTNLLESETVFGGK